MHAVAQLINRTEAEILQIPLMHDPSIILKPLPSMMQVCLFEHHMLSIKNIFDLLVQVPHKV